MGRPAWVFLDECGARLGSFWQGQVTRDGWSVLADAAGRDPTKVMGHRIPFWEIAGSGGWEGLAGEGREFSGVGKRLEDV